MGKTGLSIFEKHVKGFIGLVIAYVLAVPLAHYFLPVDYIWWIAAFFSIVMNFVYPIHANHWDSYAKEETGMASFLIFLSLMGPIFYGPITIFAIAGHGLWDWAKHFGLGVSFFRWYPPMCAIFDFGYAAALAAYHFRLIEF